MNRVTKLLMEKAESHLHAGTIAAEYARVSKKVQSLKVELLEESKEWDLVRLRAWERDMSYFTLYREELRRLIVGEHPSEDLVYNQIELFV